MSRAPFIALGACAAVFLIPASASAATFVVTPPFKIQAAIDAALASPDVQDLIFVNPGVFDEALTVDFSGNSQDLLYIAHNTSARPVITGGVTIKNAHTVTFDGFDIRSSKTDSVAAARVDDSAGAAFVQCVFGAGDFGGIDATGTFEVVVNACSFGAMDEDGAGEGGFGVRVVGNCAHRILDSKFDGDEGRSIWIEADRSEISGNTVTGASGDSGVFVRGLVNLVKKTTVKDCDGDGVRIDGVCEVNECTLKNNGGSGVRVGLNDGSSFTGGSIKKSTIKDNDGNGILIDSDQDGLEVRTNKLTNNSGAGVRVRADGCSIRDNDVKSTNSGSQGGHGVLIEAASEGNCVRDNSFGSNSGNGIVVEGDDNYVYLNTASDSDGFIDNGSGNAGRNNSTGGTNDFD